MRLDVENFFKYFITHPESPKLDHHDRAKAWAGTIALFILTLGIVPVYCAIRFRKYTPIPKEESPVPPRLMEEALNAKKPPTVNSNSQPPLQLNSSNPKPPETPILGLLEESPSTKKPTSSSNSQPLLPNSSNPKPPETPPSDTAVSQSGPIALETEKPQETDKEIRNRLEKQLWENYFDPQKPELLRFLQIVLIARQEDPTLSTQKLATAIVTHYVDHLAKESTDSEVKNFASILIDSVEHNLKERPNEALKQVDSTDLVLIDGNGLRVFSTYGEGSCGFHALLGQPIKDQFRLENIEEVRKEFCQFLLERWQERNLPIQITNIIEDYFDNFEMAPNRFKRDKDCKRMKEELAQHASTIPNENLREQFLNSEAVIKAYLANMELPGTYLTQDELVAVADWKGISIRLAQPGWYNDRDKLAYAIINPGHSTIVDVLYYGEHYSRAELIPLEGAISSTNSS